MIIAKQDIAAKIAAYLHHEITIEQLVDRAECVMLDGEIEADESAPLAAAIARLGVADVRAFGLGWEDCEDLLRSLGYRAQVEVVAR